MKCADPVETSERERDALLWNVPLLRGSDDPGTQQWVSALTFSLNPGWGAEVSDGVRRGDVLSLAAHVVDAVALGGRDDATEMETALRAASAVGELFAWSVDLALRADLGYADRERAVTEYLTLVGRLADRDLAARLALRCTAWVEETGTIGLLVPELRRARAETTGESRLGYVLRRFLKLHGDDEPGVREWGPTGRADDPLLSLPWVRDDVATSASALAVKRVEASLRGAWDTHWTVGRTPVDDLQAALVQARWCGAARLARTAEGILAAEVLASDAHAGGERYAQMRPWAVATWARHGRKGLLRAVKRHEADLPADEVASVLSELRDDPTVAERIYWRYANVTWDLLDEASTERLLNSAVKAVDDPPSGDPGDPGPWNVLGNLLWRLPRRWTELALADPERLTLMTGRLEPDHVTVAPAELLERAAVSSTPDTLFAAAARYRLTGEPESSPAWSTDDVASMLAWDAGSVSAEIVGARVRELLLLSRQSLAEARVGVVETRFGVGDPREVLGLLAADLDPGRDEVARHLLEVVLSRTVPREWQTGALLGLRLLRERGGLPDDVTSALLGYVGGLGTTRHDGTNVTQPRLIATAYSIVADRLDAAQVGWLAQCVRDPSTAARVEAAHALAVAAPDGGGARAWSLVSALFDPADEVVLRTLSVLGWRTDPGQDEQSAAVVATRVRTLFEQGSREVRQAAVRFAGRHVPDLGVDLAARARQDVSWLVRQAADDLARGEGPSAT